MKSHNYSVYILECNDGCYYTGVTNNLERRLWEHNTGFNIGCYTYTRRPLILRYYETTKYINQAILREKQLKGWSRKKKEALFKEDWNELIRLSKSSLSKALDAPSTSSGGQPSTSSGGQPSTSSGGQPSTSSGGQPSTSSGGQPSTSSEEQTSASSEEDNTTNPGG